VNYSIQHCGPDYYVCNGGGTVCAAFEEQDARTIKQALELLPAIEQMMHVVRNAYADRGVTVREWLAKEPTARAVIDALLPDSARAGDSAPALAGGL